MKFLTLTFNNTIIILLRRDARFINIFCAVFNAERYWAIEISNNDVECGEFFRLQR